MNAIAFHRQLLIEISTTCSTVMTCLPHRIENVTRSTKYLPEHRRRRQWYDIFWQIFVFRQDLVFYNDKHSWSSTQPRIKAALSVYLSDSDSNGRAVCLGPSGLSQGGQIFSHFDKKFVLCIHELLKRKRLAPHPAGI